MQEQDFFNFPFFHYHRFSIQYLVLPKLFSFTVFLFANETFMVPQKATYY